MLDETWCLFIMPKLSSMDQFWIILGSLLLYESVVNNATGVNQASNPRSAVSAFFLFPSFSSYG